MTTAMKVRETRSEYDNSLSNGLPVIFYVYVLRLHIINGWILIIMVKFYL